jgi:hypothetical protein
MCQPQRIAVALLSKAERDKAASVAPDFIKDVVVERRAVEHGAHLSGDRVSLRRPIQHFVREHHVYGIVARTAARKSECRDLSNRSASSTPRSLMPIPLRLG